MRILCVAFSERRFGINGVSRATLDVYRMLNAVPARMCADLLNCSKDEKKRDSKFDLPQYPVPGTQILDLTYEEGTTFVASTKYDVVLFLTPGDKPDVTQLATGYVPPYVRLLAHVMEQKVPFVVMLHEENSKVVPFRRYRYPFQWMFFNNPSCKGVLSQHKSLVDQLQTVYPSMPMAWVPIGEPRETRLVVRDAEAFSEKSRAIVSLNRWQSVKNVDVLAKATPWLWAMDVPCLLYSDAYTPAQRVQTLSMIASRSLPHGPRPYAFSSPGEVDFFLRDHPVVYNNFCYRAQLRPFTCPRLEYAGHEAYRRGCVLMVSKTLRGYEGLDETMVFFVGITAQSIITQARRLKTLPLSELQNMLMRFHDWYARVYDRTRAYETFATFLERL